MNSAEKLRLAHQLEALGVDVIEAGFPIASLGDREAVRGVAREIRESTVAGLARARREDIEAALDSLGPAAKPRVHVFLATSDLHPEIQAAHFARRGVGSHRHHGRVCACALP